MARRKGKAARGKNRAVRAPTGRIEDVFEVIAAGPTGMIVAAGVHCPLCAAAGVEPPRPGVVRVTGLAGVGHAPLDTV